MRFIRGLFVFCTALLVGGSVPVHAAIFDGDVIHLNRFYLSDSTPGEYGSEEAYGGKLSGGEFQITDQFGQSFKTFCLEYPEPIVLDQHYLATIEGGAALGGLSGGIGGYDPISGATQWFYRAYRSSSLDDFMGADGFQYDDHDWANALQSLFWRLEGEIPVVTDDPWVYATDLEIRLNADKLWQYYLDNQAFLDSYVDLQVQVINLWDTSINNPGAPLHNPANYALLDQSTDEAAAFRASLADYRAQSQLYMSGGEEIPPPTPHLPEPASVVIWGGFAALGLVAARRKRQETRRQLTNLPSR